MTQGNTLDVWAIVDLFGHNRIAGRISEQHIAGVPFVRIDVPENSSIQAHTEDYHPNAIYSIKFVSEEIARGHSEGLQERPIQIYELPSQLRALISPSVEDRMEERMDQIEREEFEREERERLDRGDDDLPY